MTYTNRPTSRQRGFTLVELLVAVAVIGVAAAAYVTVGTDLFGSTEVSGEQLKLKTIQRNVKDVYSGRSNFANLDTQTALDNGVFPDSMVSGSAAINAWGGNVTISAANDTNGNADRAVVVTWGGVEEGACGGMATGTQADQVSIDGSVVTDATGSVDPAQSGSQCTGGPSDIEFLYEK